MGGGGAWDVEGNQGEATKGRGALQVGGNDDNHMLSTCTKNCKKRKTPSAGLEPTSHGFRVYPPTDCAMQGNGYQGRLQLGQ